MTTDPEESAELDRMCLERCSCGGVADGRACSISCAMFGFGAPPGYMECCKHLEQGAADYALKFGIEGLSFRLPPADNVIGPLAGIVIEALGANTKSREFLAHLDEATGHQATLSMAIRLIAGAKLATEESGSAWNFLGDSKLTQKIWRDS